MGNTTGLLFPGPNWQDHPHIHGEYIVDPVWLLAGVGSPPHTWGILYYKLIHLTSSRITPTYMGNTQFLRPQKSIPTGSPPHTWGILHVGGHASDWLRITPTYMGNTTSSLSDNGLSEDHPHIHGEYNRAQNKRAGRKGSPPHTWGILDIVVVLNDIPRITPTYMGNTNVVQVSMSTTKDHPHIHGEYFSIKRSITVYRGSPPHTWGIQ